MSVAIVATSSLRLPDMVIPDHLSRDLRRADLFIQLAVIAAHQVLATAPAVDSQRTGIFLGTAFGPMPCNLAVLDDLVMAEPISPTLFSHSVFNAASGYISRICKIYGPALTLTSFGSPFFRALESGWQAIAEKRLEHALVLQVETYSPLLADARRAMLSHALPSWPPGATAWLLGQKGPCCLDQISVREEPCAPEARLAWRESTADHDLRHPLAAGEELSSLIASGTFPHQWRCSSAWGKVALQLSTGGN